MISHCQFRAALVDLESVKAADGKLSTVDGSEEDKSETLFTVSFEDTIDTWVVLEELFEHKLTEVERQVLYFYDVCPLLRLRSQWLPRRHITSLRLLLVYHHRWYFGNLLSLSDLLLFLFNLLTLLVQPFLFCHQSFTFLQTTLVFFLLPLFPPLLNNLRRFMFTEVAEALSARLVRGVLGEVGIL